MWPQAANDIKAICPEVEQTCCVMSQSGKIKHGDHVVEDGDDKSTIMLVDSTFFNFFDYELTQGNRRFALDKPKAINNNSSFFILGIPHEGLVIGYKDRHKVAPFQAIGVSSY